jgi:hypothetical protein
MAQGMSAVAIAVLLSKIAALPPTPPCPARIARNERVDVRANL